MLVLHLIKVVGFYRGHEEHHLRRDKGGSREPLLTGLKVETERVLKYFYLSIPYIRNKDRTKINCIVKTLQRYNNTHSHQQSND